MRKPLLTGALLLATTNGCAGGGRPGFEAYTAKPVDTVLPCLASAWGAEPDRRFSFMPGDGATSVELQPDGSGDLLARAELRRDGGVRMWTAPAIEGATAARLRAALTGCL